MYDNKGTIKTDNNAHLYPIIIRCSCYIFERNLSINSRWEYLGWATIAFSERYTNFPFIFQTTFHIFLTG